VKRFREGLVFQAHRLVYQSTLGWRVIKNKRVWCLVCRAINSTCPSCLTKCTTCTLRFRSPCVKSLRASYTGLYPQNFTHGVVSLDAWRLGQGLGVRVELDVPLMLHHVHHLPRDHRLRDLRVRTDPVRPACSSSKINLNPLPLFHTKCFDSRPTKVDSHTNPSTDIFLILVIVKV